MVLDGVAQPAATATVAVKIFWRWDADEAMMPQYLGETVPGGTLTVPFDLSGGAIRLFQIGYTALGRGTDTNIKQAVQTVYSLTRSRSDTTFNVGERYLDYTSPSEYRIYLCIDTPGVWMVENVVSMSDPTTSEDVTQEFYNGCLWTSCASNQLFQLVDEDNGTWIAVGRGNW